MQPNDFEFWMVWRNDGHAPTKEHGSEREARKEAERLATSNPGVRFYVLKAVGAVESVKPVQWIPLQDIPF